jgi:hypothetical protein
LQRRSQGRLGFGRRIKRVHDTSLSVYRGPQQRALEMLVVLFNAVKVESVPLNFN